MAVWCDRYIEMVLDMCQRVLQDDRQTEKEARTAAQLAMVVLHHCKGRVDEYIPPMLVMISERIKTVSDTEKTYERVHNTLQ